MNKLDFCEAYGFGKHHALPFPHSNTIYSAPLQLVACDLCGLAYHVSRNGFRYYICFLDVYSRYTWIYFLSYKSDAFSAFLKFKSLVEKLLGHSILRLQTNGEERV